MKFDIVTRLRNPPFGTETSERNIMSTAADEIERLREALDILQDAMIAKKPIPMYLKQAINRARAALPKGENDV